MLVQHHEAQDRVHHGMFVAARLLRTPATATASEQRTARVARVSLRSVVSSIIAAAAAAAAAAAVIVIIVFGGVGVGMAMQVLLGCEAGVKEFELVRCQLQRTGRPLDVFDAVHEGFEESKVAHVSGNCERSHLGHIAVQCSAVQWHNKAESQH